MNDSFKLSDVRDFDRDAARLLALEVGIAEGQRGARAPDLDAMRSALRAWGHGRAGPQLADVRSRVPGVRACVPREARVRGRLM